MKNFRIDTAVTYLGENAFKGAGEVSVAAYNSAVADAAINSQAKRISVNISHIKDSFDNKSVCVGDSTEYFALIGNGGVYNNVSIRSDASETMISNMVFAENQDTPLEMGSEKVTLARVTVKEAPAFALVMDNESVDLRLLGEVTLSSKGPHTVISQKAVLEEANPGTTSRMLLSGDYLVYGSVENHAKYLNKIPAELTLDEYNGYLYGCEVTFDPNYENRPAVEGKTVQYSKPYGELPAITRAEYTFLGWYTEPQGGSRVTEDTVVWAGSAHTLYAQWKFSNYAIGFDANGGSVDETSREAILGEVYGELPVPAREGYTFDGWYTAEDVLITADSTHDVANDITVYAKWTLNTYTVSWNSGTGYTIAVERAASPEGNAVTGQLSSGDSVCYGDELRVTYTKSDYYSIKNHGAETITVTGDVDASSIYASAELNPVSDWVGAGQEPEGAQVVERKWTYWQREYAEGPNPTMDGYTHYHTALTGWGPTQGPVYSDPSSGTRNTWTEQYVVSSNYKTVYHYFRYSSGEFASGGSDKSGTSYGSNYYAYNFDSELTNTGSSGNYGVGYKYYYSAATPNTISGKYITVWKADPFTTQEWVSDNYGTRWYYQDAIYTYYFYRDVYKEASYEPSGDGVIQIGCYVRYREK